MSGEMTNQTVLLGQAVIVGCAVGIFYDIFRIFRRIFPQRKATIVAQDILFWVVSAIPVFFAAVWFGNGFVRIYFIAAVLVSAWLYCSTIGAFAVSLTARAVNLAKKFFALISRKILKPVVGFITSGFKKVFFKAKNQTKKRGKKQKRGKEKAKSKRNQKQV